MQNFEENGFHAPRQFRAYTATDKRWNWIKCNGRTEIRRAEIPHLISFRFSSVASFGSLRVDGHMSHRKQDAEYMSTSFSKYWRHFQNTFPFYSESSLQ